MSSVAVVLMVGVTDGDASTVVLVKVLVKVLVLETTVVLQHSPVHSGGHAQVFGAVQLPPLRQPPPLQ